MRKNLFLICIFLLSASCLLAQDADVQKKTFQLPKHEFHLSWGDQLFYGIMTDGFMYNEPNYYPDYYYNRYDWFSPVVKSENKKSIGSFSLSYHYRVKKWFWVGGILNTATTYGGQRFNAITGEQLPYSNQTYFGFAPSIRFSYLNRKHWTLYSSLSLGFAVLFNTQHNNNQTHITTEMRPFVQFTYFGVAVGSRFFGNVELGVGNKGIISVGLGYKF